MKRPTLGFAKLGMSLLGAAFALVGCGRLDGSEFEGSTPTKDTVALVVPAASSTTATTGAVSAASVTVKQSALLGDTAKDYVLTATLAYVVNTATVAVLGLVKAVTDYPPTSVEADTAVWGPFTDPLSANTYRLTVVKQAPHVFAWKLDGKGKTADDSAFVTILSGVHTRALDDMGHVMPGFGSGNFVIDWDAADTLPQHDANVGQMAFTYSRQSPTATVTNNVDLHQHLRQLRPVELQHPRADLRRGLRLHRDAGLGRRSAVRRDRELRGHHRGQRDHVDPQPLDGDGRRPHRRPDHGRRRRHRGRHLERVLGFEFPLRLQRGVVRSEQPDRRLGRGVELRVPERGAGVAVAVSTKLRGPGVGSGPGALGSMKQPVLELVSGGKPADSRAALRELYTQYGGTVYGRCQYILGTRRRRRTRCRTCSPRRSPTGTSSGPRRRRSPG